MLFNNPQSYSRSFFLSCQEQIKCERSRMHKDRCISNSVPKEYQKANRKIVVKASARGLFNGKHCHTPESLFPHIYSSSAILPVLYFLWDSFSGLYMHTQIYVCIYAHTHMSIVHTGKQTKVRFLWNYQKSKEMENAKKKQKTKI